MEITALGHAGFCVETEQAILILDPWLSPSGAFDSAWFQLPRNHHMAAFVQEKLQDARKERFLYISHEHKDHFDLDFLNSLSCQDFTLIIPRFRRAELRELLKNYRCKQLLTCQDGEEVPFGDGSLVLFLEDAELNRDSAVLIKANKRTFLNINDCKIHDRLPAILRDHGPIDVFTAQFSGAIWHPTCYDYPRPVYESISRKKMLSKFEAVARAIQTLNPRIYLTSAGPACFLDPLLFHLNFEPVNIFPRGPKFLAYLEKRLKNSPTQWYDIMPGDVLDVESGTFLYQAQDRLTDDNFEAYMKQYAAQYEGYFRDRQLRYQQPSVDAIWASLKTELERKLAQLILHDRVKMPLYFRLSDDPCRMLRIDFPAKEVTIVSALAETNHYSITLPSWEVARVLDRRLTWEDLSLTFRMRLNREPDVYQAVIHGFLMMEADDMNHFCAKVLHVESRQERMLVEGGGCRYSVNRYCPHQGADLTHGWIEQGKYLVCPRHRWQFDLTNHGKCTTNDTSIAAYPTDED